jgi:hypothetical protein
MFLELSEKASSRFERNGTPRGDVGKAHHKPLITTTLLVALSLVYTRASIIVSRGGVSVADVNVNTTQQ